MKDTLSSILCSNLPDPSSAAVSGGPPGYLVGGIIAILILGYLVYTLIRPEKF